MLADDDRAIRDGVVPNFGIGGIPEIRVEDVSAFQPARRKLASERRG